MNGQKQMVLPFRTVTFGVANATIGMSNRDYGIYFVSHFAYLMKGMERYGLIIQHWQSMVWNRV